MHDNDQNSVGFRHPYYVVLSVFLSTLVLALVALFVYRLASLWLLSAFDGQVGVSGFFAILGQGARFDLAIVCRATFVFLLLFFFSVLLPHKAALFWAALTNWISLLVLFVVSVLGIGNVANLTFFAEPFNTFTIESLAFDWHASAASIFGMGSISGYFSAGVLSCGLIVYGALRLSKNIGRLLYKLPSKGAAPILIMALSLIVVALLARGAISNFPLSIRHSAVTEYVQANKAVVNGAFALFLAYEDYVNSIDIAPVTDAQGELLVADLYGRSIAGVSAFNKFFNHTPTNLLLENNPPHVVFGLAESFSAALLDSEYTGTTDLAGSLRMHLAQDIVFKRFLPAHNGTQDSMVNLFANIDYPAITQSKYGSVPLDTAAAEVFRQQGYETIYLYTGFEGERNNADYLAKQGFSQFIGAHAIAKRYPEMDFNVWGGEDAYTYAYAKYLLDNQGEKPLFIVVHTLNNHPPFYVPELPGLDMPDISPLLLETNGRLPIQALETFHYSNEVMGRFLDNVKTSDYAQRTIVAITGDHSIRGTNHSWEDQLVMQSVPFYLYLPLKYKPNNHVDLYQLASHKDIMPTLYHLALSGAKYPNLGRNLFTSKIANYGNYAIAPGHWLSGDYARDARDSSLVHRLESPESLKLSRELVSVEDGFWKQAEAYQRAIDWMMAWQLETQKNRP